MSRYGNLVLAANRRFNLTGAKSAGDLAEHLIDSLTVIPYLREPYVDVGSGAGFPAIPVALATGMAVTLVEATTKKARFLESLLEELGIAGQVIVERAETAAHRPDLRERYAAGTARALGPAPTVAELVLPFLETGGVAVLQRGTLAPDETVALEDASLMLGGRLETQVPLEGNRRIVLLRKSAPTPHRFPRRIGIPAKRPLCT
ncbi:MAG TPA: 16S rRNA (guanine(527)-N(7))-methyltransferase RsmG [Candidatus Cybelea sp.]|nr:16S rRNA (guanine(527)-N(7))-methyltransferase RsmG [Candidatus Cybelea sp.]